MKHETLHLLVMGRSAAELDARYVDAGEEADSILAWFRMTAAVY